MIVLPQIRGAIGGLARATPTAKTMLSAEANGLAIDFTDQAWRVDTGLYGSAHVVITSAAEAMLASEALGLAIDFTDASAVARGAASHYGSAYIKA